MNILVIFTFDYSLKSWFDSGTLDRELSIYRELRRLYGYNFVFLTYGDDEDKNILGDEFSIFSVYSFYKKSKYKFINYIFSLLIPFKIYKDFKDFDILKQNQLLGSWTALILKLLLKKPLYIRTGYDMYQFSIFEKKNMTLQFLYKMLTRLTIFYSDFYTVTSYSDINFLKTKFGKQIKLYLRPNWVPMHKHKDFNKRYDNKIITIGRIEDQKNFELIIKSFSNTDYEIDIIGSGSLKKDLEILSKNVNTKVNFLGQQTYENTIKILKNYKYYISSSLYEGNPKSILDAMSVGCVCFVSEIDNHLELIKNSKTGYVFKFKKNNLRQVFFKNVDKIEELKNISKNAIEYVHENNSLHLAVLKEHQDYLNLNKL